MAVKVSLAPTPEAKVSAPDVGGQAKDVKGEAAKPAAPAAASLPKVEPPTTDGLATVPTAGAASVSGAASPGAVAPAGQGAPAPVANAAPPAANAATPAGNAAAPPPLPGVLIPSTAVAPDKTDKTDKPKEPEKADHAEETLDHEAAAKLFKDDELIPISGNWDEGEVEDMANASADKQGGKPAAKRASKIPPPAPFRK
jgi:hypothetical protein